MSTMPKAWSMPPGERLRALSDFASTSIIVNDSIPIFRYYRSGVELERMAKVYEEEKNYEKAFFLYCKYTTLFVECLPRHPQYKNADTANERRAVKAKLKKIFDAAETTKKVLLITFEEQHNQYLEDERVRMAEEARARKEEEDRIEKDKISRRKREMERRETELALELKQIEEQLEETRSIANKAIVQPIPKPAVASYSGYQQLPQPPPPYVSRQATYPELAQPAIRIISESPSTIGLPSAPSSAYSPPPVPPAYSSTAQPAQPSYNTVPVYNGGSSNMVGMPPLAPSSTSSTPSVDRSTKPKEAVPYSYNPMANNDGMSEGTRSVVVPSTLPDKFLSVCLKNTQANIETCGILAAKLQGNKFTVTHVLMPKQSGTADSCQTLAEEELFTYLDSLDLITVGWIHTHPSQSAFLSSVDLHTHCSYQLMMPEAIAIVCAPKHKQTGIFALTDPHGMKLISSCRVSGFHPHPTSPPLFENCGHVQLDTNLTAQIIDLR